MDVEGPRDTSPVRVVKDYRVYVLCLLRRLDRMLSGMSFVISQGPLFLDVCRVQTIGHIEEYTGIDSSLSFARSGFSGT